MTSEEENSMNEEEDFPTLKVGVFRQWPYVSDCVFDHRSLAPDERRCRHPGVCAELLHVILTTMRQNYTLVFYNETAPYGVRNDTTGEWDGYNGLLMNGTLDTTTIFGGSIYLSDAHTDDFGYTWPLLYFRDSFVIKASHASPIGAIQGLTRMFKWQVWLACAVVFFLACVAYALHHFNPKAQRIKQMTSLLSIIMLPLYGSVLAVQLAVPFQDRHTYAYVKTLVQHSSEKLLLTTGEVEGYRSLIDDDGKIKHKDVDVMFNNLVAIDNITHATQIIAIEGGIVSGSNVRCGTAVLDSGMSNLLNLVETPMITYTSSISLRKGDTELLNRMNLAILLCFEQLRRIKHKYKVALGEDDDSAAEDSPSHRSVTIDPFGLENFVGVLYVCGVLVALAVVAFIAEQFTDRMSKTERRGSRHRQVDDTVPRCFHYSHRMEKVRSMDLFYHSNDQVVI